MPERLSSLDASFLYLERPSMHMHVAAVSVFEPRIDGPLRYEDVERVVTSRIHLAPRLRQKVLPVPGNLAHPLWADDDRFDLDFHLRRAALPAPHGRRQLERAVGRVLSRPLDRSKPLWELYVFEGLEDDRTATLLKMHHAMTDGISGMLIASALFDLAPDAAPPQPPAGPWHPERTPTSGELVGQAVREMVAHPLGALVHAAERPSRAIGSLVETIAGVRDIVGMGRAPAGPFDAKIGPNRRFATAEAPFDTFREVKRRLGGTVNDVVLTAVAAGVHELLKGRREPTRGQTLRFMVPVSVRSTDQETEVGNRVVPAFIDAPIGAMSPPGRLARIREAMAVLKESSMAEGADAIIGLGAYAPPAMHAAAARLVSRGQWFNLVVSNVPAPQVPLYLAGARLVATYPANPLGETCGLSIACTSIAGTMAFGLTADWDAVPDLETLARGIEDGVGDLAKAAGV